MATFTNQARLSYNDSVTNSNIARGEILDVITASKRAIRSTYEKDDKVSYVISIKNTGTTELTNLSISDNLGAYTYNAQTLTPLTYVPNTAALYIDGVLQATPTVEAGPPLVISAITIPAGKSATVVYEARTNEYAPLATNASITNTATITATDVTGTTVSATISTLDEPLLSIAKSVSPVPVTENGELTYTFTIQNFGNTAATTESLAKITDTFNPVLKNISVTFNGQPFALTTDYTYDTTSGLFETVAGKILVDAATFTQGENGVWGITPGESILVVKGTI